MDIRLLLMTGGDIPIPECQLILHQPTIKEIGMLSEEVFFMGAQCLCLNKSMYVGEEQELLKQTTNFEIFITIMSDPQTEDKKEKVKQVLQLLFPSYSIAFTPRSLLFNNTEGNSIIDESNFDSFQEILKQIFCLQASGQDTFNPANAEAKKIADKIMRNRQKVAALKAAENGNGSILGQYLSILTVGLNSMSLLDLMNLTMYQIYDLIERYTLYLNWDLDIRTRLAGGKPDSKPDNWMKNLH